MTSIESVILEVPDVAAANTFYAESFGLDGQVKVRESDEPTSGFRGFTLSLIVSQPANVDALFDAALAAGATALKPVAKSFWGYGGVLRTPDGSIWKVASSSKKNTGPASRQIDDMVLLLGVEDVAATKQFYVSRGLEVARSFGRKYVEFSSPTGHMKLGSLRPEGARKGRRRPTRRERIAPDHHERRCRQLHRPRRIHLGIRVVPCRMDVVMRLCSDVHRRTRLPELVTFLPTSACARPREFPKVLITENDARPSNTKWLEIQFSSRDNNSQNIRVEEFLCTCNSQFWSGFTCLRPFHSGSAQSHSRLTGLVVEFVRSLRPPHLSRHLSRHLRSLCSSAFGLILFPVQHADRHPER